MRVSGFTRTVGGCKVGNSGAYAAGVEGDGDWDLIHLTGSLNLGHRASIHINYKQL